MNTISQRNMNSIFQIRRVFLIAAVGLFVMTGLGYGQDIEQGQIEATGQVGLVSGIGTHGAFGGSVGAAMDKHFLAFGEFLFIPLGVGARSLNFDGGVQYQFRKQGSTVPYAGGGLGLLHSSASFDGLNLGSSNDFYVNFGGGVRYYMTEQWGFRPELTIFAGPNTFVRIGAGVFYRFGK